VGYIPPDWRPFLLSLEVGTVLATMVIVSPVTRKGHFIVLLIPVMAALSSRFRFTSPNLKKLRNLMISGAIAVGIISVGTSRDIIGKSLSSYLVVSHNILLWTSIIIWTSCTIALIVLGKAKYQAYLE